MTTSTKNSYSRRYMHGENPNAAREVLSGGELHGYVGKVLEICGALTLDR